MKLLTNREELLARIRAQMHEKRFNHTLGVAQSARNLAVRYGADPDKAELAGLLHDYCKCWPVEKMFEILVRHDMPTELLEGEKELWHAFAGAIVIQTDLGVTDTDILQAVRYHTTGRAGMSLLEKVVCVADYIEPNRIFPGVDEIRALAEKNLDQALALALGGTIQFLIEKQKTVYPLTLIAYNDLVSRKGREGGF
ncbi:MULTISPECIES: bis(5'-nucleosyl)-tetraphosphatase (symmetrical) YqeK [Brevibacillus]|jgi:predicted HD superfamily hydrolase involved in NAD metabolism|uniref:bis(5'-nucleosyl)-tetraphosphatase (symmetrical) n=1 Tax=Brevibacillus parabrevis TaxID=54914 RepID=A0A4Y3PBH7_BREPA|nr:MULTISPECIES: bis(5'-nucleosyl)-tetraphosphatase (symmetrical) YqeK [Brevibacillus]MBU8714915.1 bis(5'-nucleosyl)-tetraphosphatase (symmetrical) YqeK [Brevibacillus parabrevis]MDH6352920.1 putative HD superfamily hydrolase involved in NAD metabolism [Brevibacillus sp. 1238]MDR5000774.1 bis(5'-nucleosyl)-tetraphosphatase (symmetrical) YqeK [Brevibacillus parabrevis]MED1725975.1 bis(5'-nucleosyl)-tetraphosphatase (symmetrical) YqeK [Brevibacillus parabrevis]MED2253119.1 bis(5'-nucleosyl)-tetr